MPTRTNNYWKKALSHPLFLLLLLTIFHLLFLQLKQGFSKESWQLTEWLINYQGGFVRRGLPGEILFHISKCFAITPYYIIVAFCFLLYGGLVAFFCLSFRKMGYSILILPFFFFLGGPAVNNFVVRKDIFEMVLFIAALYCILRNSIAWSVLSNACIVIGLLAHEAIGLLCLPVIFLLLLNQPSPISFPFNRPLLAFLKLLPALIAFAAMIFHRGSLQIAEAIWTSWSAIPFPYHSTSEHALPAAVGGLTWSVGTALNLTKRTFLNFNDGIYAPLAWLLIIVTIFYLLRRFPYENEIKAKKANLPAKPVFACVLLMQLLAVLPLFAVGWDYGRWIFSWITSSFAILVLVPADRLAGLFPPFFLKFVGVIDVWMGKYDSKSLKRVLPYLIGVPVYSWSLTSYFLAVPAVQMLRLVSLFLHRCIGGL